MLTHLGDPLLQFLTTRIHAVRPAAIAAVPTQKGKGQKKKDKSAPSSGAATPAAANGGTSGAQTPVPGQEAGRLWEVELEDTVIFPEGQFKSHLRIGSWSVWDA